MTKQLQNQAIGTLYDIQIKLAFALDNKDWSLVEQSLKEIRGFTKEHQNQKIVKPKKPKPIQRLTHCPSCESKENQEYSNFTDRTICGQCNCVYGSYGGEVYF